MLLYDTHVFLGPTIDTVEASKYLFQAHYHPPIQCGDLIRLLRLKPARVLIIDGIYETVPSVWHKEIMLTIDSGVQVFGAASMGALRASELHHFGMIGIGDIFQQFANKDLVDDDEVAVLHNTEADNFIAINQSMVNIRATLNVAKDNNIISNQYKNQLVLFCKKIFYPYRSLQKVIEQSRSSYPEESHALSDWLFNHGVVDLKKIDAISALKYLQRSISNNHTPDKKEPCMPATKFIGSLINDVNITPFKYHKSWLPPIEKKLLALSTNNPLHFRLIGECATLLNNLFSTLEDDIKPMNTEAYLNYIKQNNLYSPSTDFKIIQEHPTLAPLYPVLCKLICLSGLSNKQIKAYLPAASLYFMNTSEHPGILRLVLILILLNQAQLQDDRLKIKKIVVTEHLKQMRFWKKYQTQKSVDLYIAIDFVAVYMQVSYIYQGFRDSNLGAATKPYYFKWIYDAYALYEINCNPINIES